MRRWYKLSFWLDGGGEVASGGGKDGKSGETKTDRTRSDVGVGSDGGRGGGGAGFMARRLDRL